MTIGMLHTTQSAPGTFDGNVNWFTNIHPEYAPHWLIDPLTQEKRQFTAYSAPSKALRNLSGGVETNNRPGGVIQVEIVGMAEDLHAYPDWWYENLAQFLREISAEAGIAYQFHTDPARFTFEEWSDPSLAGWYGHVNVPENDHWDPGTLDYAQLAEEIMTTADLNLSQLVQAHPAGDRSKPTESYTLGAYLQFLLDCANNAENQTKSVPGIANAVQAILTLLQNGAAGSQAPVVIDYARLANAVCDELARRLAPR